MSTRNGVGTMYYGWRHAPDGTATATTWFTLFWLPVLPLRRERLRLLAQEGAKIDSILGGLVVSQSNITRYQVVARIPISPREILLTWAMAVLGMPMLIVLPPMLVFGILLLPAHLLDVAPERVAQLVSLIAIFHITHIFSIALRRSRGDSVSWLGRARPLA